VKDKSILKRKRKLERSREEKMRRRGAMIEDNMK
jgi:hypothetical protein